MEERLAQIGQEIMTQDNRITAEPIFVVQSEHKHFGIDPEFTTDGFEWYHEGSGDWFVKAGAMFDWLEANCNQFEDKIDAPEDPPDGFDEDEYCWGAGPWSRVFYKISWEFATCCFTEHGCKAYMDLNGHNLKNPRIYVYSGNRNREWIDLRQFLKTQHKP